LVGYNKNEIIIQCINQLQNIFKIDNWFMNDVIYISEISDILLSVPGVQNVVDLSFVNKIGDGYSNDIISKQYYKGGASNSTLFVNNGEISIMPINNSIHSSPTSIFEIKYPNVDLKGRAI
jgi:hypothetical protein